MNYNIISQEFIEIWNMLRQSVKTCVNKFQNLVLLLKRQDIE
jgi:hypothetical protein